MKTVTKNEKSTITKKNNQPTKTPRADKNPTVLMMATKEEKKELHKMIQNFAPTAEERIKNAENFKILTTKFEHLKEKKDELDKFKISSDGTQEKIYLENSEGFKFEVSNTKIMDETLKLLENTLNGILSNTKKQVEDFII
ncbi:hypothetical protein [Flavicella sp.]|uniref:hypothetical protein n=1 Tax=Flavicella sp. TaxID=2957742 RepID=UPI0030178C3C